MNRCECPELKILNLLMSSKRAYSTREICNVVECDRKTVYKAVNNLEINGFGIELFSQAEEGKKGPSNFYRFSKLYEY